MDREIVQSVREMVRLMRACRERYRNDPDLLAEMNKAIIEGEIFLLEYPEDEARESRTD